MKKYALIIISFFIGFAISYNEQSDKLEKELEQRMLKR